MKTVIGGKVAVFVMRKRKSKSKEVEEPKIGSGVVYIDEEQKPHLALVTYVHPDLVLNLAYVSPMKHGSSWVREMRSVLHQSKKTTKDGYYWV